MKKLFIITLLLLTTVVIGQTQLNTPKNFPKLGHEELKYNTVMMKDSKTGAIAVSDGKTKVLIKRNDVKVFFPDNRSLSTKLVGRIYDVKLNRSKFISIQIDTGEAMLIAKDRKNVIFVGKRYTTTLLNK